MKREQKEIFIKNLKTILSENSLVLVFHYRGMSMTDMTELRVQSFNSGCNIKVTKNRLTKLALEGTDKSELSGLFDGPTAIAYSNDPVQLTKLLTNFAKNNSNLVILGGIMDNEILTVEKIDRSNNYYRDNRGTHPLSIDDDILLYALNINPELISYFRLSPFHWDFGANRLKAARYHHRNLFFPMKFNQTAIQHPSRRQLGPAMLVF